MVIARALTVAASVSPNAPFSKSGTSSTSRVAVSVTICALVPFTVTRNVVPVSPTDDGDIARQSLRFELAQQGRALELRGERFRRLLRVGLLRQQE